MPAHKNTNTKTGFEEKILTCICAGTHKKTQTQKQVLRKSNLHVFVLAHKTQIQTQVLKKRNLHVSLPAHKHTNTKTGFEEKQLTCICAGTQKHKHKNRF